MFIYLLCVKTEFLNIKLRAEHEKKMKFIWYVV